MRKHSSTRSVISGPQASSTPAPRKSTRRFTRNDGHRQGRPLRAGLAIVAGRTAGALSRRLHLGGGTSIAGIVAQQVYPDIIEHLATQLAHGSVIVTGTNGKTTTSGFIANIMRSVGMTVWHNKEGSNLTRGVASSLVIRARPNGRLRRASSAISILEVDEATLPAIVQAVTPRVAVFTNLFRDQLDRYGEVNSVADYWRRAINTLPPTSTLVLNADDPTTATLGEDFSGQILYYGIDELPHDLLSENEEDERHQVIDTRTCPRCGSDYHYDVRFYSHLGHYHCNNCGLSRPSTDIKATAVHIQSFDRLHITVQQDGKQTEMTVPLPGIYNVYNALAAITAARALEVEWDAITSGIQQSKPAFGRGESLQVNGKTVRLLLAKNPTGFNEVMRTLFLDGSHKYVLFVLNDNIADGQDISWIWDVDFEQAVGKVSMLVVAGTRALDLALRFKYAGIAQEDITIVPPAPPRAGKQKARLRDRVRANTRRGRAVSSTVDDVEVDSTRVYGLKRALDTALASVPDNETLYIIPTYTALLEVHHDLEQRGAAQHYWEGRDA